MHILIKGIKKKKYIGSISLINVDAKIPNKIPTN
jgi:hypothetical protein